MNTLTPEIQNELLKAARRSPVSLLFSGDNERGKTLAAEVLAVHYDLYLFRVDLARLLAQHPGEAEAHLERLFARAGEAGDMLCFDGADALLGAREGSDAAAVGALSLFLYQLRRYKGVIIVSVSGNHALDEDIMQCFGPVIRFPTPPAPEGEGRAQDPAMRDER